jgi:hypothetical protein
MRFSVRLVEMVSTVLDYSEQRFIYMYDRLGDVSMSAMAERSDQSAKRGNAR